MKRKLRFVLILGVFSVLFFSFSNSWAEESTKHFIWKMHSTQGQAYLMGSMHILKEGDYPLPKVYDETFKAADALVFEIDQMPNSNESAELIKKYGLHEAPTTLHNSVSKNTLKLLQEWQKKNNLPPEMFKQFKPWLVAVLLPLLEFNKLGFDSKYGLDAYFLKLAKQAKKRVLALETAEIQFGFFNALSAKVQEAMLKESLVEINLMGKKINELSQAWKGGDAKTLASLTNESLKEFPEVYEILLVKRNQDWTGKIEGLMKSHRSPLIIVGAAHLVGPDGLIKIFESKGYSVEQL